MVRLKTRYLLFEILYPDELEHGSLNGSITQNKVTLRSPTEKKVDGRYMTRLIRQAVLESFGEYGAGVVASTIAVKYFSQRTSTGIVRVTRPHFRMIWSTLSDIRQLNGRNCIITVKRVSGTIKKCQLAAIGRNKSAIDEMEIENNDNRNNDEDILMEEDED